MNIRFLLAAAFFAGLPVQVLACSPNQPEDFAAFFTNFSNDKSFALSRTVYPSSRVRYTYMLENGKQEITEFKRQVKKQDDIKYPALGDYMKTTGIIATPQGVSQIEAVVELSKPDASLLFTYHFSAKQGCWFLTEIQRHVL
jgi:hypothetical protein